MLSEKFFNELKQRGKPYYQLAWEAGLTPNQLYKITSGIDRPDQSDPRIVAICKHLGISVSEAFEEGSE